MENACGHVPCSAGSGECGLNTEELGEDRRLTFAPCHLGEEAGIANSAAEKRVVKSWWLSEDSSGSLTWVISCDYGGQPLYLLAQKHVIS
jgi:hypothetical protein